MQHMADKNHRGVELSSSVLLQMKVKVASSYRAFSNSCHLFIRIVLTINFEFKVLTDSKHRHVLHA